MSVIVRVRRGLAAGSFLYAVGGAVAAGQVPTVPNPWLPPVGIPQPSFGILETPGIATHYVDNTNPAATDSSNPNGSAVKPRLSVPTSIPAGSVVEVRGGPYVLSSIPTWTASGVAGAPVFIRGVNNPVFTASSSTGQVSIAGSYFVIEGITFDKLHFRMQSGLHHFALRRSIVRNYSPSSNSAGVNIEGTDIVLVGNEIHNNGDPNNSAEVDIHGIKASENDARVWIVDNHIHHNGGDSVQIGSATASEPWARFVYVGRNVMHNDRENAVDIKQARDIIVSENQMYGYIPRSSSAGEALIVHNMPDRVWVINNVVRDAARGIVSTGAIGFYVFGNLVTNIHESGFSTTSLSDGHGIMMRATSNVVVSGNTVWNVDGGISQDGSDPAEVVNNIVGAVSPGGHHFGWGNTGSGGASLVMNNLLAGSVNVLWGSERYTSLSSFQSGTGKGQNSLNADPRFAGTNDFRLLSDSPALDRGYSSSGAPHPAYALFTSTYPQAGPVTRDLRNILRPAVGAAWDIGSYESNSSTSTTPPAAPTALRIIR